MSQSAVSLLLFTLVWLGFFRVCYLRREVDRLRRIEGAAKDCTRYMLGAFNQCSCIETYQGPDKPLAPFDPSCEHHLIRALDAALRGWPEPRTSCICPIPGNSVCEIQNQIDHEAHAAGGCTCGCPECQA